MEFDLEKVPAWAHSWCYFFVGVAVVAIFTGFASLFMSKKIGMGLAFVSLLSAFIQAATAMTMFWMCRASLKPSRILSQL